MIRTRCERCGEWMDSTHLFGSWWRFFVGLFTKVHLCPDVRERWVFIKALWRAR